MIAENLQAIRNELPATVKLLAVSKFQPLERLLEAYQCGQRLFGENRPQELAAKAVQLPQDIEWHFIGHLQTNKLKKVLPYVSMVESVDSLHLLEAISRWGVDNGRRIDILLELHLGAEQTKQGFTEDEILGLIAARTAEIPSGSAPEGRFPGVRIRGLMGMATNTPDEGVVKADFERIAALWRRIRSEHPALQDSFTELSIGMSSDWPLAVASGSTLVRIGTAIFGSRSY